MAGTRAHLVDAYCHGVFPGDLGLGGFEARLPGVAAPGTTLFDSPTGFAVRRWCPPLLGLEPHCPPAHYLARRRELGAYEAARLLLRGAGIDAFLVDTGEPGDLTPPKELGAAAGASAHEIVRLEPLAQQVADTSGTVDSFLANLAEGVHGAAMGVAGFSCGDGWVRDGSGYDGSGYDGSGHPGPGHDGSAWEASGSDEGQTRPPGPVQVRRAAARWLATRMVGARPTDPVLLRHLRWHAVATGLPLLLRYGPGGSGPRADETFLRATAGLDADVVLLPGAPHEAGAADLAAELAHVYVAVGTDPAAVLARTPFGKVLHASGTAWLPELYVTAARRFGAALDRVVAERVGAGEWSAADGTRVAALVGAGNARRVYRLPEPAGHLLLPRPPAGRLGAAR
jgi:hypothetical protein